MVQRQVLYLGEINDAQQAAWCRSIAVFSEGRAAAAHRALFPEDRPAPKLACEVVQVKQKVSGCFRSEKGAHAFAAIRPCLPTLRKRSVDLYPALVMTFPGNPPMPRLA